MLLFLPNHKCFCPQAKGKLFSGGIKASPYSIVLIYLNGDKVFSDIIKFLLLPFLIEFS